MDRKTMFGLFFAAVLNQTPVPSRAGDDLLRDLSVNDLKRTYLACERASELQRLPAAAVAQCSAVYEALKARGFGGDFEKVLAWARSQRRSRGN